MSGMSLDIIYWFYKTWDNNTSLSSSYNKAPDDRKGHGGALERSFAEEKVKELNLKYPDICHFSTPITE